MPSQNKNPVPPSTSPGFRIFARTAYAANYNFAVANYNNVSVAHKASMFGDRFLLFRSVVAVSWIIATAVGCLAIFNWWFVLINLLFSVPYMAIALYNIRVFIKNRSLLNATRLLRAKVAGPSGTDFEWVPVPLDSRSANERLAAVEQSALDNVRREYSGSGQGEIECMVYTKRYADTYPSFPKELLLHFIAFLLSTALGIFISTL